MVVLQKHVKQLYDLAGDAAENVLDNHPQLKEKFGGGFNQLKELGDAYGPQAKEEVDRTWQQIYSIVKRGASIESTEEIKNLIQEKKTKLEKLGDEAWKKGFEESQRYLDKSPKLKQMVEDNADTLKKGNPKDLWALVKESASSGKIEDVEKYINEKVRQAKKSGTGDLDKWLNMVPGGSNVIPQLQSLQTIAQNKGGEAENVLKETVEEIQNVLKKRKEQVEKIAEEGKEESK
jgi:cell division septum initiation protein DivIVA